MTSPSSLTARLRGKLTDWSDDDEDIVPKKVERRLSMTPEEDVNPESRELSPAEPSPPKIMPARKRIARAPCLDSDEEDEPYHFVKLQKVQHGPPSPKVKMFRDPGPSELHSPVRECNHICASRSSASATSGPAMQAPVQPGCTQSSDGKSRFLAYNMLGSISRVETEAGFAHVEVDFHDTSKGMRVPSMTDFFGFTMAALNERGCVFANPMKGDKTPSTIMYRPFNSWTSNSEWSMRFPVDEEVKAVAIGIGWAAAATSQHFLRIYTEAGLQRFVLSLAGPVVSLAGNGDCLAVVTHGSNPLPSGDQVLEFMMLNVRDQNRLLTGRLPLSPASTLTWLGFTEAGSLSTYDSQGVLRVYSSEYDGCWIPVFSAAAERKKTYWVVGLSSVQVYCIECKGSETQPQVLPKPVMSVINTTAPVVHSDLGADDLESDFLRGSLHLTHTRSRADEAAAVGRDDDEADEAVFKMEVELDRCLLRLISAACKGDKLARALELSTQLSLHKSMEGALKLVTAMRLPSLAERMNQLLEERSAKERAAENGGLLKQPDARALHPAVMPTRSLPESLRTLASTSGNTYIKFSETESQEAADAPPMQPSHKVEFRSSLKKSHKRVTADPDPSMRSIEERSADHDSQAASLKAATVPEGSFVSLSNLKPSNPFAKKVDIKQSEDDKNDSILQSLKKMQTISPEIKHPAGASTQRRPAKIGKVA